MLQHVATHSISINCPPGRLFDFIVDPANWPKWSIVTCESVKPLRSGCWLASSLPGQGQLTIDADPARRLVHFAVSFPEDTWNLACEVRGSGSGAELLLTFPKPDHCDEACFDDYVVLAESRLQRLKFLLGN